WGWELQPLLRFFLQTDQAFGTAVTVDILLGQHGPKPAFQRAASGIGRKFRNALTVTSTGAVEIGVQAIGEIAGGRILTGNSERGQVELFAEAGQEDFPGGVVAAGARPGQRKFVDTEGQKKSAEFSSGSGSRILTAHLQQDF